MKSIKAATYHVHFESKGFTSLRNFIKSKDYSQAFILCDENLEKLWMDKIIKLIPQKKFGGAMVMPAGEEHKTITSCKQVWDTLLHFGADRHALLINLGGGVISDLGGFCASVYKRGISFINIPTTLLAMADASVGGKNGIDYQNIKNTIGTITQPNGIFVQQEFLSTLPENQIISGLAEIIKMGIIADKNLFDKIKLINTVSPKTIMPVLHRAVELKNKIVTKDPLEKNIRKILNFGHTIGHAIESYYMNGGKSALLHGEAIYFGMLAESILAMELKLITLHQTEEIEQCIRKFYSIPTLKKKDIPKLIELMRQDKKNQNGKIGFALPSRIGLCKFDVFANEKQIASVLNLFVQ